MSDTPKLEGVVLSYRDAERFGFIRIKGRKDHLFVHGNDLLDSGIKKLERNMAIRCRIAVSAKSGKAHAIDIEVVS